jgi:hypothetical protein
VGLEHNRQLQGKARDGPGLLGFKAGHTESNTRIVAQDATSLIQDQVAGMPAAAHAALRPPAYLRMALIKSVAADNDKDGKG